MAELLSPDLANVAESEYPESSNERRDTTQAVMLWRKRVSDIGFPPPLTEFDLTRMASEWAYRFVISGGDVEHSAFLVYGARFARLLELTEKPISFSPMIDQIPERYRSLFTEGAREAISDGAPARYNGVVAHEERFEFYRAAFMPVRMNSSLSRLIFGSFNYHIVSRWVSHQRGS